jgi:hypothetical protein
MCYIRSKSSVDETSFKGFNKTCSNVFPTLERNYEAEPENLSTNKTDSEKFKEITSNYNLKPSTINYFNNNTSHSDVDTNQCLFTKNQRVEEWLQKSSMAKLNKNVPEMKKKSNVEKSSDCFEFNDNVTCVSEDGQFMENERKNIATMSDKNNLVQMEYNVKKFLLKQSEWSMYRDIKFGGERDINFNIKYPQRTETNL